MTRPAHGYTDLDQQLRKVRGVLNTLKLDAMLTGLRDAQAEGYPSATMGGGGGGEPSTQPERGAIAALEGRRDPAAQDLADLRRLAKRMLADVRRLEQIARLATPHRAGALDPQPEPARDMVGIDNHPLWCRNCLEHGGQSGCDPKRPAMGLCRRCADWKAEHDGRLPDYAVARAHANGDRVTSAVIEQADRERVAAARYEKAAKGSRRWRRGKKGE